jgi:hypothetical protein
MNNEEDFGFFREIDKERKGGISLTKDELEKEIGENDGNERDIGMGFEEHKGQGSEGETKTPDTEPEPSGNDSKESASNNESSGGTNGVPEQKSSEENK